ncbi:permease [Sphaerochaeta associata]|uniref:Permease n=1 Tax=Sphaerochaeta associata TaxID=1129264 RepID=A0ABY4DHR2_9SPIR|nr:permease [Sphaerochaeta associata]UOM52422.1 permease [Sphaerochaeta associata]
MSMIFDFLQYQVLGMRWLNDGVGSLLALFGMDAESRVTLSLQFFIYDVIKILILLSFLVFLISYIQSYFPPERTKRILGRFTGWKAYTLSALLGTVTPFCSCSSIPLFIGFTAAGLPLGVTFSFLISSPLVDLGSLLLLSSIFGFPTAILYVAVGLVLAVIGGSLINRFGREEDIEGFIRSIQIQESAETTMTKRERVEYAKGQVKATVHKVFWYIIIGVGIGAVIHNWIPSSLILAVLGSSNPFSVIIAAVVGIPMYADIFGTLPIAEALWAKGVGLGTILAFMMGVTVLSLPSLIMLRKAVKPRLLALFFGIVTVGIILIGYVFNGIGPFLF